MKFKMIVLAMILFLIPFIVNAKTCDSKQIIIDSVTIKEKTNNVSELEQPEIEGTNIKLNIKMMKINDSIEYKMIVKNNSNEDFELDENRFNANSDYIEYTIKTDDNDLVIKEGKSKEIYLKVQYKKEVPDSAFINNKINDKKSFVLSLSNNEVNSIQNPKTGDRIMLLAIVCILVLCIGITTYILLNKKKNKFLIVLVLGLMIVIPISTYALCNNKINIDFNVTIEKGYEIGYLITYRAWYTDEELENYQTTPYTGCEVYYIGEDKYNECSYIIKKDGRLHSAGERVNLETQIQRTFKARYHDDNTGEWVYLCEEIQNDTYQYETYQCSSPLEKNEYTISFWFYDMFFNEYGYTYDKTDKQVMNFNTDYYHYDGWDDDGGYFSVEAPQEFTMPEHNVLFVDRGQG